MNLSQLGEEVTHNHCRRAMWLAMYSLLNLGLDAQKPKESVIYRRSQIRSVVGLTRML